MCTTSREMLFTITPDKTMLCIRPSVLCFVFELLLDDLDAVIFLHSQSGAVTVVVVSSQLVSLSEQKC